MMYDVAIIGGGPAGQSAALVCGRARLKTVFVDAGPARNFVTQASHGFLTRDGAHPSELAEVARAQLRKYPSVEPVHDKIVELTQGDDDTFSVRGENGSWSAKRVVIATGYRDDLDKLAMPGVEDVYGKSVFPCPFCDGFEHADEKLAVFMHEGAEHFVPIVRIWSDDVVLFTNGKPLSPEVEKALSAGGVPFETGRVERLTSTNGRLTAVVLEGGKEIAREAAFIGEDYSVPSTTFAADLGVGTKEGPWGMPMLDAGDDGRTSVPGLFVVGDAKTGFGGLVAAANEGHNCAASIVHDVALERWGS